MSLRSNEEGIAALKLMIIVVEKLLLIKLKVRIEKILGEYGSDPYFPRARAPEYSMERGQAYLLSSEWVQELPCRSGRHIRIHDPVLSRTYRSSLVKTSWCVSSSFA